MTIECTRYTAIDKGALMASVDVYIPAWDLEIKGLTLFRKDARKWIGMPSKMYEKDGEKKYFAHIRFREKEKHEKFQEAVMKAIEEFCQKNNTQHEYNSEIDPECPF